MIYCVTLNKPKSKYHYKRFNDKFNNNIIFHDVLKFIRFKRINSILVYNGIYLIYYSK